MDETEKIAKLNLALRSWKCRRCHGGGTTREHQCEDDDHDWCQNYKPVTCEACFGFGLHRIASLALGLREKHQEEIEDEEYLKRGVIRTHAWD